MSKSEKMVLIRATRWETPSQSVTRITWVDINDKKFKRGDVITFKEDDPPTKWVVTQIFDGVVIDRSQIHQDWHVGGL